MFRALWVLRNVSFLTETSQQPCEAGTITIPIIETGTLRA